MYHFAKTGSGQTWGKHSKRGDAFSCNQLIGGVWPDNSPSVSCLDWRTGEPNAKYWVTNLLATTVADAKEKSIVASDVSLANGTQIDAVYSMAYSKDGKKGILLVNKKQVGLEVTIGGATGGSALVVEVATEGPDAEEPGFAPIIAKELTADGTLMLGPFGVAVVTELVLA